MKHCLENIMPDSLTGAILAVEGIKDAVVILNGPTGCKFYHGAVSDDQFPRELSFDPLNYPQNYYFGQPRVPATYLDGHDYIYGSSEKLKEILKFVSSKGYKYIAVINSPGAALIGDDLNRFMKNESHDIRCTAVESTGFSGTFTDGFQKTMIKILESLDLKKTDKIPKSVNLIGISIYQKYYEGNINEIKKLLNLCGIKVISTVCAGDSINDISDILKAELNLVLCPEYGEEIAKWLYQEYKMPYLIPEEGAPVGFMSVEEFIKQTAEKLETDFTPANEVLNKAKAKSYLYLSRFNSMTGLPKGAKFAVKADQSIAYSLTKWLYEYLGMVPEAVEVFDTNYSKYENKIKNYLSDIGFTGVFGKTVNSSSADIVLADGNTIAQLKLQNKNFSAVEISLPSLGYIDVTEKSIFGVNGSLRIIEYLINGLKID